MASKGLISGVRAFQTVAHLPELRRGNDLGVTKQISFTRPGPVAAPPHRRGL